MKISKKHAKQRAQLSDNITFWRIKKGMTKKEVAMRADMSYKAYLRIENNKSPNPALYKIFQIAKALGVKGFVLFENI